MVYCFYIKVVRVSVCSQNYNFVISRGLIQHPPLSPHNDYAERCSQPSKIWKTRTWCRRIDRNGSQRKLRSGGKGSRMHFIRFEHRWTIYGEEWNREGLPDGRSGRKSNSSHLCKVVSWWDPEEAFRNTLRYKEESWFLEGKPSFSDQSLRYRN